jgi:hypothetical protein
LRRYLSGGRLVAALASVHVVADVRSWDVRFNNARQSTIWTIPGLAPAKAILTKQFETIITAQPG